MCIHTTREAREGAGGIRRLYERLVYCLRQKAIAMQAAELDIEAIARALHAERRALSIRFKELTPEPLRTHLYDRTFEVYGDRFGPTIEYLRGSGKSWAQIVESATRPGPDPSPPRSKG